MAFVEGIENDRIIKVLLQLENQTSDMFMVAGEMREHADQALDAIKIHAEEMLQGRSLIRCTYTDDDGDACTLTTGSVHDALTFTTLGEADECVLKVTVLAEPAPVVDAPPEIEEPPAAPAEPPVAAEPPAPEPTPAEAPAEAAGVRNLEVHMTVACDGCDQQPILGKRFKCLECHDYDLCERCFKRNRVDLSIHDHAQWARIQADSHVPVRGDVESAELVTYYEHPSKEAAPVHLCIVCDVCEVSPIVGSRFKCTTVPNYDLCSTCYARRAEVSPHGDQPFEELVVAPLVRGAAPDPVLEAKPAAEAPAKIVIDAKPEGLPELSAVEGAAALKALAFNLSDDLCLLALQALMKHPDGRLSGAAIATAVSACCCDDCKCGCDCKCKCGGGCKCGCGCRCCEPEPAANSACCCDDCKCGCDCKCKCGGGCKCGCGCRCCEPEPAANSACCCDDCKCGSDCKWKCGGGCKCGCGCRCCEPEPAANSACCCDDCKCGCDCKCKCGGGCKCGCGCRCCEPEPMAVSACCDDCKCGSDCKCKCGGSCKCGCGCRCCEPEAEAEDELKPEDVEMVVVEEEKAPADKISATVVSSSDLVLGVEAAEDTAARGDITEEFQEMLRQVPGTHQAYRCGRMVLPTSSGTASVPAEAKLIILNNGNVPWPEAACLSIVAGDPFGLANMALGPMQPGEAAEVILDLDVPQKAEPGLIRSAWSLMDANTGESFGPLIFFEVAWMQM